MIITISLMAFLVLLLITVGTFTRIETQVAGYTQKQSIAREHAKKAMETAIAELQKYAGQDQRVTARAEIATRPILLENPQEQRRFWNNSNPYWTGVWDTTRGSGQVPVWLVSGNEYFDMIDATSYPQHYEVGPREDDDGGVPVPGPTDPEGRSVWLVGPGSAAPASRTPPDPDRIDGRVKVLKQPILVDDYPGLGRNQVNPPTAQVRPSGGLIIGNYAYVVLDEGVKASLVHGGMRRPWFEHREATAGNSLPAQFLDTNLDTALLQDEVLNILNPGRFGLEPFFQISDFSDSYNPSYAASWLRILSRDQAKIFASNGGLTNDDLRLSFHETTSSAQAVFVNTAAGGGPRLKNDLSVSNPDINYTGVFANTAFVMGTPNMDGSNRIHPIATLQPLTENPAGGPVVKQVRLFGGLIKDGAHPNPAVALQLRPMIEVWNPYTADLTWFDGENPSGYRFQVRIAYEPDVPSGVVPDLFALRLGAGIHWRGQDPADPDQPKDVYTWWFSDDDTSLFSYGPPPLSPPTAGPDQGVLEETIEFITDGSGFGHSAGRTTGTRLLAGESAIFSGSSSGVLAGGSGRANPNLFNQVMPRGRDHPGAQRTLSQVEGSFNPTPPGADVVLNPQIVEARPTIVLAPGQPAPRFRVQVFAVPENATSIVALEGARVPLLGDVYLSPAFLELDEVMSATQEFQNQMEGTHGEGAAGQAEWDRIWSNSDVTRYGGITNFHENGTVMELAMGLWRGGAEGNVISYGLNDSVANLGPTGFNFQWGNSPSQLHGNLPAPIAAWGNQNGYGYGFSTGGVGDPATEFVNLLDAPRMPFPSAGALDGAFSSMVELTGNPNNPLRFNNPRVRPYSRSGGIDQEVIDNLTDNDRFQQAAFSLLADGAFNVNSTSVEAWAALLNSFGRYRLADGNRHGPNIQVWDPRNSQNFQLGNETDIHSAFPRFSHAPGATFFGRINQGDVDQRSLWRNGFRELRPLDLGFPRSNSAHALFPSGNERPFRSLYSNEEYFLAAIPMAEYIVQRIKQYYNDNGRPFRSLQDFRQSNIMQDAINSVEWGGPGPGLNWYRDPYFPGQHGTGGNWERIPRSSPSFLTQDDIFRALGSVLTVRSDTFVIRAYGDSQNPVTGEVEARAYLEAIVQRVPVPLNPGNPDNIQPNEYQNPPNVPNSSENYGRRFELISFRWLDPSEI